MILGGRVDVVYKRGWVPICAALLCDCNSTSIAPFPVRWGIVDATSGGHCEISGDYKNIGESVSYGISQASNEVFLDHLLVAGRDGRPSGRITEYVSLRTGVDKLVATLHSKDSLNKEAYLSLNTGACQHDGYALKFSSVTQSEYSAVDHRTVLLALMVSVDGSLIGKASIEFVSKGLLISSTSQETIWYRFEKWPRKLE